jgi:hypothetical protein
MTASATLENYTTLTDVTCKLLDEYNRRAGARTFRLAR